MTFLSTALINHYNLTPDGSCWRTPRQKLRHESNRDFPQLPRIGHRSAFWRLMFGRCTYSVQPATKGCMSQLMPDAERGDSKAIERWRLTCLSYLRHHTAGAPPAHTPLLSCPRAHGHPTPSCRNAGFTRRWPRQPRLGITYQPSTRGPSTLGTCTCVCRAWPKPPYVRKWTHGGSQSWAIFT